MIKEPTQQETIAPHILWQNALANCQQKMMQEGTLTDSDTFDATTTFAITIIDSTKKNNNITTAVNNWVENQKNWYALNLAELNSPTNTKLNIQNDDRLSNVNVYMYLLYPNSAQQLSQLDTETKKEAVAHIIDEQLTNHLHQNNDTTATIDCHIMPADKLARQHKLAFFDMDSTLIEQEVIVELAKATGIGEKVNEITESAMRGEIDFDESFTQRVGLLKDTPTEVLDKINDSLTLSAGAKTTIATLNTLGYHTVLVSGGFTYFAKHIAKTLGIAEYHANELDTEAGKVTGKVQLPIVNGEKKAEIVQKIAKQQGVTLNEVICVGDGANDLAMMAIADFGLAYRAKPIVQAKADLAINSTGLDGVLYALGMNA